MLMTGTLIFMFEPCYRNYSASNFPLLFANYLTKANGSVFTIIPWFGYIHMEHLSHQYFIII